MPGQGFVKSRDSSNPAALTSGHWLRPVKTNSKATKRLFPAMAL